MMIHTLTICNGINLLIGELPYRHAMSVNIRIDAGARRERPDQGGLAHMVEHLLFQGTQRLASNFALTERVERTGAELWGATHSEYTSYWLNGPVFAIADTLPILLDLVRFPQLDEEHIERERRVILDELAEGLDDGRMQVQVLLDQALWGDHPLGRSLLGTAESVQYLTPCAVRDFFKQFYRPQGLTLAVVGDVSHEHIGELVQAHWQDWHTSFVELEHDTPAPSRSARFRFQPSDHSVVYIMLGFTMPPLNAPSFAAATLLRTLLCDGMSSYLYTALRGTDGLCYSLEHAIDELRHTTVLTITLVTQPQTILSTLRRTCTVFKWLREEGPDEIDLERARGRALGKVLCEADKPTYHARLLSLSAYLHGSPSTAAHHIEQLKQVKAVEISQLIADTIHPGNCYAGVAGGLGVSVWQQCEELLQTWTT